MRYRCRCSQLRFPLPASSLGHHQLVAFASCIFQLCPVHDVYVPSAVFNQSCLLQNASSDSDASSSRAQHVGEKFLSQGNVVATESVLTHQQPSRQSLMDFMRPIARRDLRSPALPWHV